MASSYKGIGGILGDVRKGDRVGFRFSIGDKEEFVSGYCLDDVRKKRELMEEGSCCFQGTRDENPIFDLYWYVGGFSLRRKGRVNVGVERYCVLSRGDFKNRAVLDVVGHNINRI